MNNRIRELDKAAQEYAGRICGNDEVSNWNEWLNVYKEKFAQLIVTQCVEIARVSERHGALGWYEITKHFGVEE